ncbi:MAG: PilN domain-containing protein [Burkholderiales bacterium]|nr:PilN domain-containing protein [Burkholderiales bacterium]
MILINLLPHREEKRKRRRIAFFVGLGASAVTGLVGVGLAYGALAQLTAAQQDRNKFLTTEIKKLEIQIKDIVTLKGEIESLIARQRAVEDLQSDRNLPVHLLNELATQTPEGIYLMTVKQDGRILNVNGIAQTQERISEFLRNTANTSEWLVRPELVESKAVSLQAANRDQKRMFDFTMRLNVSQPQDKAAAAAAPASAASAPAQKKA